MFPAYGFLGIFLVILSYLFNFTLFIPEKYLGLILPHFFFIIGLFLFFDASNFMLHRRSLLYGVKDREYLALKLLSLGFILGIIFEWYGVYISDLWYSYFQSYFQAGHSFYFWMHYFLGLLAGYGLPSLMYFSAYDFFSSLLKMNHFLKKAFANKGFFITVSEKAFLFLGLIGTIFLILPIVLFRQSLNWNPVIRGLLFGFCLLGLWFILEYIEHRMHRHTFLTTLLHKNFIPLLTLLIISVVVSLSWESLNVLRPSWVYHHLPLMGFTFFGLPVTLIIAWPMLFVIYFSAYRIIFNDKKRIW